MASMVALLVYGLLLCFEAPTSTAVRLKKSRKKAHQKVSVRDVPDEATITLPPNRFPWQTPPEQIDTLMASFPKRRKYLATLDWRNAYHTSGTIQTMAMSTAMTSMMSSGRENKEKEESKAQPASGFASGGQTATGHVEVPPGSTLVVAHWLVGGARGSGRFRRGYDIKFSMAIVDVEKRKKKDAPPEVQTIEVLARPFQVTSDSAHAHAWKNDQADKPVTVELLWDNSRSFLTWKEIRYSVFLVNEKRQQEKPKWRFGCDFNCFAMVQELVCGGSLWGSAKRKSTKAIAAPAAVEPLEVADAAQADVSMEGKWKFHSFGNGNMSTVLNLTEKSWMVLKGLKVTAGQFAGSIRLEIAKAENGIQMFFSGPSNLGQLAWLAPGVDAGSVNWNIGPKGGTPWVNVQGIQIDKGRQITPLDVAPGAARWKMQLATPSGTEHNGDFGLFLGDVIGGGELAREVGVGPGQLAAVWRLPDKDVPMVMIFDRDE